MTAEAMAIYPQLLERARELCGPRASVEAEDLVGVALLEMVRRPPSCTTPDHLRRWLRTVMRNKRARAFRDRAGVQFASYEAIVEARANGADDD